MLSAPLATVVAALIAAIVGGIGVAVVTYFLNRKKWAAEIAKTHAETEKLLLEVRALSATVSYGLAEPKEDVLFDGREQIDGFVVKGVEGVFWTGSGSNAKPTSPKGEGSLSVQQGVLNVQRKNTAGRFELFLQEYTYRGRPSPVIPKNDAIAGKRKLRVSCEAKAVGGEHSLRFVIRNPQTGRRLAEDLKRIALNEWTPIEVFLQADATEDSQLRIDDEGVSVAPSSIQVRKLFVAERTA